MVRKTEGSSGQMKRILRVQVTQNAMWSIFVVINSSIFSFAPVKDKNQFSFKHSERTLPLKNSIKALSVGFLGLLKSSVTLFKYAH